MGSLCPSPESTTPLADNLATDTGGASRPSPVQLSQRRLPSSSSARSSPSPSPPSEIEAATAAAAAAAIANTTTTTPSSSQGGGDDDILGRGKRRSPVGTTTARMKKIKKTQTKIKLGCRIYSTRKSLFLCGLLNENQQNAIRSFPQNFRLHGTVKSGKGTSGYNVEYDLFPAGDKLCRGVLRNRMTTLKEGEEEIEQPDSIEAMAEIQEEEEERKKKLSTYHQSIESFKSLSQDEMMTAKLFELRYGNGNNDILEWEILPDNVHITEDNDHMEWPDDLQMKKDIQFDDNSKLTDIFFHEFFPCITGHAKLIDDFHSDARSPFYQTVQDEKIVFHREEEGEDPDWVVKQCYLLMIAAVTEAEIGVENLWKRGESGGRHKHPDFGQYVPKNVFKAFTSAAAFAFCEKKWWYTDKRDRDWDIFTPVLESFNEKRRALFHSVLLMLDESMSAWKPKTSKTGGLPNLTNEPRKPVDLGSQLRNAVECFTGVLAYQDVVMGPEKQRKKKYYYSDVEAMLRETTSLPKKEEMSAHTAEVLRQVEGAGLPVGGWVGGDAWFGSVMTAVELRKRLGVHSTFIVKNNKNYFPMEVLHSVLKARHGSHPAGHWVVMRAVVSHVPVIAIAYAWSQKGVSYFISTCGKTTPSPHKYEAKFEDDWGNTSFREIPRPDILHVLYEYVPLIDEHNKSRQSILAMEKRWQTRNPWFRLITTMVGMSVVVDMYQLYRHQKIKIDGWTPQEVDALRIIRFTDLICGNLRPWKYQHRKSVQQGEKPVLERICDKDGNTTAEPTSWQRDNRNNSVGNPITHHCFICRRYLTDKGTTVYDRKTSHWCRDCHMPLCEKSRVGLDGGRDISCVDEHCCSEEEVFACSGRMFNKNTAVPKDKQVSLYPRRSSRVTVGR